MSVCGYMAGNPRPLHMQLCGCFAALLLSSNMVNTPLGSNSPYGEGKLDDVELVFFNILHAQSLSTPEEQEDDSSCTVSVLYSIIL